MILQANALAIPLSDASVNCVVTSPPYYGLRDYGVAGQLGLEPTPDEYVANMVAVFREVKRVLKKDGVCWLNLGDSYVSNPGDRTKVGGFQANPSNERADAEGAMAFNKHGKGCKPKDLFGIPWRVAFALQADGWWLRSDIIWAKPNPMPESVTDRPTRSHEYIFLLTKSARYWYDAAAIAEESIHAGETVTNNNGKNGQMGVYGQTRGGFLKDGGVTVKDTRNARSVWTIATKPFKDAHFATFPPELAKRCILAGCPTDGTVLDPFSGSGTTVYVAQGCGRKAIGLDLNMEYCQMAQARNGFL